MSDGIHEISAAIGELKALAQSTNDGLESVLARMDQIIRNDGAQDQKISSAHRRLDELKKEQDDIKKLVLDHEALKNKGIGVIAIVGLIFAAIGNILWVFISKALE